MSNEHLALSISDGLAELAGRLRASVVQVQAGPRGVGSGIIWRAGQVDATGEAEAIIITNAHVIGAGRQGRFMLRLADARELPATLVAIDPAHDLAALRVRATGLRAAAIGDSTTLRVGELVVAVGNPFGREGAVTAGIVAARAPADPDLAVEPAEDTAVQQAPDNDPRSRHGRWRLPRIDVIQADIQLYPGNSGGPLANACGQVVGVNAMVGGGLAFAIPSRVVQQFLAEVERAKTHAYIGVLVLTAPLAPALRQRLAIAQETAAVIAAVEAGSPAEAAGVLVGDVLLAVDGQTIRDARQLPRALDGAGAMGSQPRTLSLLRGGERRELSLVPALRAAA
jgi:serine protease Do